MRGELHSGDVLTVTQLAEYLQLHKLTVYKYIREGRIPAVRIGRIIRIRAEDVGMFLLAQQTQGAGRPGSRPRSAPGARPAAERTHALVARPREEEIQVGPQLPERTRPHETFVDASPIDWATRWLH